MSAVAPVLPSASEVDERIGMRLSEFKLPTLHAEMVARFKQAGLGHVLPLLLELLELEASDRRQRRIQRLLYAAKLPPAKTFETFLDVRLPARLTQKLRDLSNGNFLDRADNVLAFGLPGTGKTHAACALGHALALAGHSVLFTPTYQLVQQLLAAKRDLALPRAPLPANMGETPAATKFSVEGERARTGEFSKQIKSNNGFPPRD
ncbi:MAG: ATP-binding protein, partial [Polyangiaceae bacterium]|nr:ATP-binding protein [Polyangiaceae bacterium]